MEEIFMKGNTCGILLLVSCTMFSEVANAAESINLNASQSAYGYFALLVFALAYALVIFEEQTAFSKSKPMVIAAGIIWISVALLAKNMGISEIGKQAVEHMILEFAELMLFLLVAMTYVNTLDERNVFASLKSWLTKKQLSYKQCFWVTGILAFFISPIADNLTTALLMCAVIMAIGEDNHNFILLGCINIVVAANAGGAFSPFGDITTLMVWQKDMLKFSQFFHLFIPALVNFLIPAAIMHRFLPSGVPVDDGIDVQLKYGGMACVVLFILTIVTAVIFENYLTLPATMGMLTGLGYLMVLSYHLKLRDIKTGDQQQPFNIFNKISKSEWDTLFFFYGVILSVGGLAVFGYLNDISEIIYTSWGQAMPDGHQATIANVMVGIISAIIDNIPVMFAILTMSPTMSEGQWLLVTLTAGVGGSLLSVGSAAGVALMGQTKGIYTFMQHLRWTWAIGLGYFGAILIHIWLNSYLF